MSNIPAINEPIVHRYNPYTTSVKGRVGIGVISFLAVTIIVAGVLALKASSGTDLGQYLNHLSIVGVYGSYGGMAAGGLIAIAIASYAAVKAYKCRKFNLAIRLMQPKVLKAFDKMDKLDPRCYNIETKKDVPVDYMTELFNSDENFQISFILTNERGEQFKNKIIDVLREERIRRVYVFAQDAPEKQAKIKDLEQQGLSMHNGNDSDSDINM